MTRNINSNLALFLQKSKTGVHELHNKKQRKKEKKR